MRELSNISGGSPNTRALSARLPVVRLAGLRWSRFSLTFHWIWRQVEGYQLDFRNNVLPAV